MRPLARRAMPTPVELRVSLVDVLHLDLVGPEPGSEHEEEVLPTAAPGGI
jgi:hypothetical protein